MFSAPSGKVLNSSLDLGGFGVSRFTLDLALYLLAQNLGVEFLLNQSVNQVEQTEQGFELTTSLNTMLKSRLVLGAFGKRSNLDANLNRAFFKKRSPYLGVKYHIKTEFPKDLIALHNFKDGYCGISAIENNQFCLCYLSSRNNLKKYGNIAEMEREVLHKNPHLNKIFNNSEFIFAKPEVINEISFEPKEAILNGILMLGDAAGLITPLCGNGMAMAIHGAKIAAEFCDKFLTKQLSKNQLDQHYQKAWNGQFRQRLWIGRQVQKLFGDEWTSELALNFYKTLPWALTKTMQLTHGKPF
jgi:flavin-dependent dehydrogenase